MKRVFDVYSINDLAGLMRNICTYLKDDCLLSKSEFKENLPSLKPFKYKLTIKLERAK